MTTDITTVEADGQFYVNVSLDGHDKQYGPYSTADEAEIMAARMGAICRGVFHQQVEIGVVPRSAHVAASRRQGAGFDMEDSANGRSG